MRIPSVVTFRRVTRSAAWLGRCVDMHPLYALSLILLLASILGAFRLWRGLPTAGGGRENLWWQVALSVARGHGYMGCGVAYFPFCGPSNQVTAAREPVPVLLFASVAVLTHESLFAPYLPHAAAKSIQCSPTTMEELFRPHDGQTPLWLPESLRVEKDQ